MYTDPIADFLTRIRNASLAGHKIVDIPSSKIKYEITKILFDQGLIFFLIKKPSLNDVYQFLGIENSEGVELEEP